MAPDSNGGGTLGATVPRRVVASYSTYRDAERAVDYLSDNNFPVERVSIVGRDLELVEQVTGRMTYAGAALRGALSGAVIGVLIAWLFSVFSWFDPTIGWGWLILDGLWFGTLVGALFGLLSHAMLGGRRDFASIGAMRANRYEVLVDDEVATEAERLISRIIGESERAAASDTPTRQTARN
jgi:heat induced stress protein YflT